MEPLVTTRTDGPLGWLIFDNQERHNAMTYSMWLQVPALCRELDEDPTVRVVILAGAGDRAFVAGADISEFAEKRTGDAAAAYDLATSAAYRAVASITKPTLAMIRGFCLGGGMGLALAADIRYCSEGARFSLPPAKLGIGYEAEGLERLVDLVGPGAAKEMVYTANLVDSEQAESWGLVSRRFGDKDLDAQVRNIAGTMATRAPLSQAAAKRAIEDYLGGRPDPASVRQAIQACADSNDYAEGVRAFLDKRDPVFRGS